MINYVYIFFLPGAAGNFFSRCISLASDRCVGQIPRDGGDLYLSLDKKFELFRYTDAKNSSDWIEFESHLVHYSNHFVHHCLAPNSVSVWHMHPDYDFLHRKIDGKDDKRVCVYIDPSEAFEWCTLNCLYKDSYPGKRWMIHGKRMLDDQNIQKINLVHIFSSHDTLLLSIQKVCDLIGIDLEPRHRTKIIELWKQWIDTTLPHKRFTDFKREIGYFDT